MTTPKTAIEEQKAVIANAEQKTELLDRELAIIGELKTENATAQEKRSTLATMEKAKHRLSQKREAVNLIEYADVLSECEIEGKPLPAKVVNAALEILLRQHLQPLAITRLGHRMVGLTDTLKPIYARIRELESELATVQREILGETPAPRKPAPPIQAATSERDKLEFAKQQHRLGNSCQTVRA